MTGNYHVAALGGAPARFRKEPNILSGVKLASIPCIPSAGEAPMPGSGPGGGGPGGGGPGGSTGAANAFCSNQY